MYIDVTMGTLGRHQQFKRSIYALNDQKNVSDIVLYLMDGNVDNSVDLFINGNKWGFRNVHIIKEHNVLPDEDRGLWPKIYNYLMKLGKSQLVTYWSDDLIPERDCLHIGSRGFNDHMTGAVAFAWQDGPSRPFTIYGTEIHKQVMVNFGLYRRTVLEQVGFIDDKYKFYNADQDLSLKIWYIGKKVVRCSEAKVTHSSGGKSDNKYRSGKWHQHDIEYFRTKWSADNVKHKRIKL